ncbi:MAG: ribbon-helix-helix domain-containing protein [Cyanobacteriota bacterium]
MPPPFFFFNQGPSMSLTPRRISVTVPTRIYERLLEQSYQDGRSMSNLASFILEAWLDGVAPPHSRGR